MADEKVDAGTIGESAGMGTDSNAGSNGDGGQKVDDSQLSLLSSASADASKNAVSDSVVKGAEDGGKDKTVGDKKEDVKAGDEKPVVPEKYEFKLPDDVKLEPAALEEVESVFKKLGLNQEQAQALMDFNLELSKRSQGDVAKAIDRQRQEWMDESKKELGADMPQRLAMAAKARDAFASPEFIQILKDSGLENNIHVIKTFESIGKKISEDKLVEGSAASKPNLSNLSPRERLAVHIEESQKALEKAKK